MYFLQKDDIINQCYISPSRDLQTSLVVNVYFLIYFLIYFFVYFTYIGPDINGSHGKDGNNNGKVGYETTDPVGKETLGFEFFQMPGYQKGANE